jgi:hypothetical protein
MQRNRTLPSATGNAPGALPAALSHRRAGSAARVRNPVDRRVAPATRPGPRPWAGGIRHGLPRHRRGRTGGGRTVCPPSHRPFPPARQRLPPADGHPSRTRKPRRGHAGLRPRRHDATRGTRTRTRSGDPEGARPPAGPGHERTLNPRGTGLHGAGPSERACFRFSTSARDRITVIQTTGTDPEPSAPSECSFSTKASVTGSRCLRARTPPFRPLRRSTAPGPRRPLPPEEVFLPHDWEHSRAALQLRVSGAMRSVVVMRVKGPPAGGPFVLLLAPRG